MFVGDGFAERPGIDAKRRHIARLHARQQRKYQLGKTIGFLEMRIARHDEGVDADVLILLDPRRDSWGSAAQPLPRATGYEPEPGPGVGADLEFPAAPAMQLRHTLLADR